MPLDHLLKTKKEFENFKNRDIRDIYTYRNEQNKACFRHDMAHGGFKDLSRRTVSNKALRDKAFNIAEKPEYYGYQRGLASIVYIFFDKNSTSLADKFARGSGFKSDIKQKEQLAEELHKPIIKTF